MFLSTMDSRNLCSKWAGFASLGHCVAQWYKHPADQHNGLRLNHEPMRYFYLKKFPTQI